MSARTTRSVQTGGPASDDHPAWVEVVYALPDKQRVVVLEFVEGLTAVEAARRSGLAEEFPEISTRPLVLGLFGERVDENRVLARGDRIEISRPLLRDPRDLRREMLAQGRVMGAASKSDSDG